MNGEQQHEREEEKRHYRKDQLDDEIDVLAREFWKWLQKQSIDLSQWITAIATAMLVIVTLFYTIYAAKQAKSTETAARAAKLAADTSKDALIASNRPWLGLDGSVTLDILDKTPVVKLAGHYAIKNFGQGPAIRYETLSEPFWSPHNSDYLVFGKSACAIPIQFVTEANRRDPKIRDLGPIGSILFPGEVHPQGIGDGGPWWGNNAEPSMVHVWVVGCVAYIDEFNALHWTRFCVESSYFAKSVDKNTPLQFCAFFNDSGDGDPTKQR